MVRLIRKLLASSLGTEKYLRLVSASYIRMVNAGMMKNKYPELFFLKNVVRQGDYCIDLGANVGYYSTQLSKITGSQGKVFAVEPVTLFRNVLKTNLKKFNCGNVELLAYALGAENKAIKMGTPEIAGVFRHGLTKVIEKDQEQFAQTYEVEMRIPDELFSDLTRLDFIKCDVEGYEIFIFPYFIQTLKKFLPLIQMEISSPDNRKKIFDTITPLGYEIFGLKQSQLIKLSETEGLSYENGDFYFKCKR